MAAVVAVVVVVLVNDGNGDRGVRDYRYVRASFMSGPCYTESGACQSTRVRRLGSRPSASAGSTHGIVGVPTVRRWCAKAI